MKARAITYSEDELQWICDNSQMPRADLHRAFVTLWTRNDVSQANLTALCKRRGWLTGRTGCFQKGQTPPNKGKKMPHHPNSAATRFKKGERRGVAAKLYKPMGTERVTKDGYIERKVNDDLPLQARWRAVHLIRWEAIHGPLPQGHALKCLDGDKANTAPENWKCIPRAMLPRLSGRWTTGFDDAPAELKPTIMAVAELAHAARTARKAKS